MEQKVVKFEIGKVLAIVITVAIVAGIASAFLSSDYYKGMIGIKTTSVTTDSKLISNETTTDTTIFDKTDLAIDTKINSIPVEQPIKIVTDYNLVVATPPQISFAYLDKIDANHPSIYGNVNVGPESVVLIFRLRNSGGSPAYLKAFNTTANTTNYCNFLASVGSTLVQVNYDANGNLIDWTEVGKDTPTTTKNVDGKFEYSEMTNLKALEIPGNSDVTFALIRDTRPYTANTAYFNPNNCNSIKAQAILLTATLDIQNSNGVDVGNIITDQDSANPGTMTYK